LLAQKEEAKGFSKAIRRKLSAAFIDRLFGADLLRVLLGIGGASMTDCRRRANRAAEDAIAAIASARTSID
jgi:TetR/AcrR family transcriptional regulator, mexJK operon transcriptional repressor